MTSSFFVQCVDISATVSVGDVVSVASYHGRTKMEFNRKRRFESTDREFTSPLKHVNIMALSQADYVRFFELELSNGFNVNPNNYIMQREE